MVDVVDIRLARRPYSDDPVPFQQVNRLLGRHRLLNRARR